MLANIRASIPALVHDIARRVRYDFDGRTRVLGVTRPQWRMLISLSKMDGPTQSEVAELLEVERITLCRMADRLVEAGLVERRADPADRRVWRLYLTEKARPIVDQLSSISEALEHDLLSVLNSSEREMLVELLTRVRDGIRSPDDGKLTETRANKAVA
jgi:DNA-binding MarR family transcriptional regulator